MEKMFDIPLIRPYIPEAVKKKILGVLDNHHITQGAVTAELEELVGDFIGVENCIAVTSCTTGLELALRCLNIGENDEVIVPAFTYPATADAVCIVGATPVFVDVDRETMLIDFDKAADSVTSKTKAMMPVSLFGNPLNYDRLNNLKKEHHLFIVEDAACALSAEFKGMPTGKQADISVFSLHPRKFITTGEGGLITTDNHVWAQWMRSYKQFGMATDSTSMVFERIGTNLKLSDILSAIGVVQMQQIESLIAKRQEQARYYRQLLRGVAGVTIPKITADGVNSYQSFCIFVNKRDTILEDLRSNGIEVQIGSFFLPEQPAFSGYVEKHALSSFRGSLRASRECLVLPLYHEMQRSDQEKVVIALRKAIDKVGSN